MPRRPFDRGIISAPRRAVLLLVALGAYAGLTEARAAPTPATAAEPDPVGAHAAIARAQERLAEMDATIAALEGGADQLDATARQKAHDAVTALRTMRDTYRKELDGVVAEGRRMTADQLRTARAALEAPWTQFEAALDRDVAQLKLGVAQRKAIVEARLKAEQSYWQGVAADLGRAAADLTAEQRAAIEARIAAVKARAAAAGVRLSKLSATGQSAWSALKRGFIDAGRALKDGAD